MQRANWTKADSHKCKQIWTEYQKQHDITDRIGQTAGIDPKSGRIWFGDSALEIVEKRETEGLTSPLFLNALALKPIFGRVDIIEARHCVGYRGATNYPLYFLTYPSRLW